MRIAAKSIILLAFLAALACHGSAFAATEGADEEQIGRQADKEIEARMGFYKDGPLQEYVARVGRRVLAQVQQPEFEFHFKVVDDEMVNAFALPGGYVYITRGMLAALSDEAELAGVLGHEIGHVINHHSVKQMNKSIGQALLALTGMMLSQDIRNNAGAWLTVTATLGQQILSGYGREYEMESDQVGLILAYSAGYDPSAIVSFLKTMQVIEKLGFQTYHSFMATHPDTISRIVDAEAKSGLLQARGEAKQRYRDRYMEKIKGLTYGKPRWRGKTLPPYELVVHEVKEGETFRSISADVAGDLGRAFEVASINGMEITEPLTPGMKVKVIVPARNVDIQLVPEEEKKYEVGVRIGDGKVGQNGGGSGQKADGGSTSADR